MFDVVIRGGTVADGTGAPPFRAGTIRYDVMRAARTAPPGRSLRPA